MSRLRKKWYQLLQWQDYMLGVWSCKAMQLRGYADGPVHPKHLFDEKRGEFLHDFFREGIRYLDLGSGVGTDCIVACQNGARLSIGLEGSRQSIQTAVARSEIYGNRIFFLQLDFEQGKLPFPDNCFDVINFSNVLEHLHNRADILLELQRVKRTEGVAIISIPNSGTTWKKKLRSAGLDSRDDPDHKIEYTVDSLEEEIGQAGLQISSELHPIIPSFPWNGAIAMSAAFSPRLYRLFQKKKREYVLANPEESIGWVFAVR